MASDINLKAADTIRILSMAMVEKAKSGHPGGAMGGADFIHVLFSEFLKYDPSDPAWMNRDRFFLDPGHMSPMLYSVLTLTGHFGVDDLKNFRQWGSITPGHPEVDVEHGVENTSGPLGQGHTMAVGAAIAERFLTSKFGNHLSHRIFTYISDGGIQEEISQGAGRIAGHLGLGNLVMFYDSNDIQLSTGTDAVTSEDTAAKYLAWGWEVVSIDGHDHDAIRSALEKATSQDEKPFLIIGKTIMGKGLVDEDGNSFEGKTSTHGQPVSKAGASFETSVLRLGGDPADPFRIPTDIKELYAGINHQKQEQAKKKKEDYENWAEANREEADKLESFYNGTVPEIAWKDIEQKPDSATRAASSAVLGHFAGQVENMIVSSADLSNSDKTDGFLKKTTEISRNNPAGQFLQAGVAELTLAAIMNGMALHGGVIPVCGTFFVFSDYMKPAVRMAALMKLPVKYIWTHDAFRVGEDGPTHQPVEHEAQIRLLEQLHNHDGKRSMLVIRPADADETTVAWQLAINNTNSPTALILSRQNIASLPSENNRFNDAMETSRGAYIVEDCERKPDIILFASGSEVATLVDGAALLKERDKIATRVISVPSEGLFDDQPAGYKEKIFIPGVPRFGLTAGLSVTLQRLAGDKGRIWGLDHFGHSAPYGVLDEKFGFTAENVYHQVVEYLGQYKG